MKNQKTTVKTKLELAKRLGLSRGTLDGYICRADAPERGPDGWDLERVAGFIARHARGDSTAAKTSQSIGEARAREIGLRCERLEFKLQQDRGEWVLKSKIVGFFLGFAGEFRGTLHQVLENEYPIAVAGCEPAQARILGKRLADKLDDIALQYASKLEAIE
jgi:hypothetical protein